MENEVVTRARDAAYTAVGFGVLAAQRLQVKRRDLTKDVVDRLGGPKEVKRKVRQAQVVIDPVLDVVERRLPLPSRLLFRGVRRAARSVETSFLG
jgi:hypothetical protein